jgi:hypothetical protein
VTDDQIFDFWKVVRDRRTWWYLRGQAGAVQLMGSLMPDIGVMGPDRKVTARILGWIQTDAGYFAPWDLGFHSPKSLYGPDIKPFDDDCEIIGGPCWYDGSSLNAEAPFKRWAEGGFDDKIIRQELEYYYALTFYEHEEVSP